MACHLQSKLKSQLHVIYRVKASAVHYLLLSLYGATIHVKPEACYFYRVRASSVHYLLLYLYGAMVEVPASDLVSVIQMSDMFGMEGLKELLAFQMSQNLCHFFHKVPI